MNPGMATMPNACFQPHWVAITPPRATPIAEPSGIEAFQSPIIRERFSMGYMAEIIAVPPGAYPASPTPTPRRVMNSCGNVRTAAARPVATLQSMTMSPTLRFRLQRSTRSETGNVKITMDQYTAEAREPAWVSVTPRSLFRNGIREETTSRSM